MNRWKDDTPESFRFCLKIPRDISHTGRLVPHLDETRRFVEHVQALGPLFLQLPPRYSPAVLDDLRAFLAVWPREVKCAVEVRHQDWFKPPAHEQLNTLLAEHDAARVLIDTRPIRCPATEVAGNNSEADLRRLDSSPRRGTSLP